MHNAYLAHKLLESKGIKLCLGNVKKESAGLSYVYLQDSAL
jgi:hypothetical protein